MQLSGSWEVVPCPFVSLHLRVWFEDVTASPSDGGRLFTATTGQVTVTLYQTAIHLPYTPICYVHWELILDDLWLCTSVCGSKVFQQELSFDRGQWKSYSYRAIARRSCKSWSICQVHRKLIPCRFESLYVRLFVWLEGLQTEGSLWPLVQFGRWFSVILCPCCSVELEGLRITFFFLRRYRYHAIARLYCKWQS